ncbi:protein neuralized-like [Argiope bruennichi]|uniref:E3 ubiquitin-protein ligase NEURL1 like protein n=1 Tax=Argiope bruennichi TaxID=94029 RepID=A0A8T0FMW8_ARGBR|nr:protein neuralized-like [Argiope bruennichi]KAF8790750.1 E3 ubiquitin-protein ligase NEURL1 like protein [Argiope bruennichi]
MGAENSSLSQKNRTVSLYDDRMTVTIRNNYDPLHFHQVHGENIKLFKNGVVACRSEGFCKGIAFSSRPVMVGEPICIKFLEISTNWSGALRIGFTMNDPMTMKSKLPRYACPDLTSIQGNWAKAIAERMAKKDSKLYYYVDPNGDVHYGLNDVEHGVFFGGVNTSGKLWAVLDIYGNTVAVEFANPFALKPECGIDASQNMSLVPKNKDALTISELKHLSFHYVHGKNVSLKVNRTVASRKCGVNSLAYVFTECSMKLEEKIYIKISRTNSKYNGNLLYGITSCNPSSLNIHVLPENTDDLLDRPEYWVVRNDTNSYEAGDVIVYSISTEGQVTVMKNCAFKSAIFHVDPTQPLWLFFNLIGCVSEINILGSSAPDSSLSDVDEVLSVPLPSKAEKANGMPGTSGQQQTCNECVICFGEQVDCAVYRCGHMCMCYSCASKLKNSANDQCPICREVIQDVIRIYR